MIHPSVAELAAYLNATPVMAFRANASISCVLHRIYAEAGHPNVQVFFDHVKINGAAHPLPAELRDVQLAWDAYAAHSHAIIGSGYLYYQEAAMVLEELAAGRAHVTTTTLEGLPCRTVVRIKGFTHTVRWEALEEVAA